MRNRVLATLVVGLAASLLSGCLLGSPATVAPEDSEADTGGASVDAADAGDTGPNASDAGADSWAVDTDPDAADTSGADTAGDTAGADADGGPGDTGADGGEGDTGPEPTCSDMRKNGKETAVDCGGAECPACKSGKGCRIASDCKSGLCGNGICRAASCDDGVKTGNETAVDCGGDCSPCGSGKACKQDSDCASKLCTDGTCDAPSCSDGVQNGKETDVDCGTEACGKCEIGATCAMDINCQSGVCSKQSGTCKAPSCNDKTQNGKETDVDCGGPSCPSCSQGGSCQRNRDCQTGVCESNTCAAPVCDDGVTNGGETDVDCGGSSCPGCESGDACTTGSDCASMVCKNGTCATGSCADGQRNNDETDVDCGGPSCSPCVAADNCSKDGDCKSGVCDSGSCKAPSCSDQTQNGQETDVDCGGPDCGPCADGKACSAGGDCQSGVCSHGTCQSPTCKDGVKNGDESDVDCGSSDPQCSRCVAGQSCGRDSDCKSQICSNGTCASPACDDNVKNGDETDVDCGGPTCNSCGSGKVCSSDSDCISDVCTNSQCQSPSCTDGTHNGQETDVDCGGNCPGCSLGETCNGSSDCTSDLVCESATNTCRYGIAGSLQRSDPGRWADGSYAGSCLEYLRASATDYVYAGTTGSGFYWIKPSVSSKKFMVQCDMQTDGGGWTGLDRCDVYNHLNATHKAVTGGGQSNYGVTNCRPHTRDGTGDHTFHYTFEFPAGFDEFYLKLYKIKANSSNSIASEIDPGNFKQTGWIKAFGGRRRPITGDVAFGTGGANGSVVTSFGQEGKSVSCGDCEEFFPRTSKTFSTSGQATKFRIGWGEGGYAFEGWYPWYSGRIYLR